MTGLIAQVNPRKPHARQSADRLKETHCFGQTRSPHAVPGDPAAMALEAKLVLQRPDDHLEESDPRAHGDT